MFYFQLQRVTVVTVIKARAMLAGQLLDIIPKHNGNPVCLAWALKGECSQGCGCLNQHVRYNRNTIQALHGLMDTCGITAAQP